MYRYTQNQPQGYGKIVLQAAGPAVVTESYCPCSGYQQSNSPPGLFQENYSQTPCMPAGSPQGAWVGIL